jgi:hypothetical protein
MARRTRKLVLVVECEYEDDEFRPARDAPPGVADLCDLAAFVEHAYDAYLDEHPGRRSVCSLGEVTAYTVEGFLRDHEEGRIAEGRPCGVTADEANRRRT